jgi:queuine tRNA-ribosyltransferase
MGWERPLISDSGGFQVYSLSSLRKVTDAGVLFRSHWDGAQHFVTPESLVHIQEDFGSDVMMVLDQCVEYPASRETVREALERTLLWADRSLLTRRNGHHGLFGILQGGVFEDLREEGAFRLSQLPFDGFAVGGIGVGESPLLQQKIASLSASLLPQDRARYLMGVGRPRDLLYAVRAGYDFFDCVLPTRNARNGTLFTSRGKLSIKQTRFKDDTRPIDPECPCYSCRNFSRAYLRHLFLAKEMLSGTLNTLHNLSFYFRFMERIRDAIVKGTVDELMARWEGAEACELEDVDG